MLKRFSSNTRKLNRVIKQINLNNLSGSGYFDNLLEDYQLQSSLSASFDGRDESGNPYEVDINGKPILNQQSLTEFSASIAYNYNTSFDTRISTKFNSNTKSNPNPTKLVNNKNKISNFHTEILQFGARQISRTIDEFDNVNNTLTIRNVYTDYGTEGASPENFEVLVFGLHIPGDYTIAQVENNVVVTLNGEYIDFDNVTINDIYVIGKLVDIPIAAENEIILSTENDLDLII
jgi:hypothetical protein